MFSQIEHDGDDEEQSAGQDEDEDQHAQDEEGEKKKPGWFPQWLPKSFGVYEAASDSGLKVRRPKSLPPQRLTTANPKLKAKLKALERDDDEEKGKVFTFSPGPSQVVSTQMQKLIEEEIRQRVNDELKKLGKIPKTTKSVSRKLFLTPDSEEEDDDDAAQYKRRMQRTFEADELKKRNAALERKKKEWYDEQERIKKLEQEIKSLEKEREETRSFSCLDKRRKFRRMNSTHGTWEKSLRSQKLMRRTSPQVQRKKMMMNSARRKC